MWWQIVGFEKGEDVRRGEGGVDRSEESGEVGWARGLNERDETGWRGEGFVVELEADSALVLGVEVEGMESRRVVVGGVVGRGHQDEARLAEELALIEQRLLGGDGEGAAVGPERKEGEKGEPERISVSRAERSRAKDSTYAGWVEQIKVACILGS